MAGAACVVAKSNGDSEAVELAYTPGPAEAALNKAKENLRKKGHKYVFPQAVTELKHAYVVVIRSEYKNARGRDRTSFGCGFSKLSYDEALWDALRDLQSHAWGWKPDKEGYTVLQKLKY